MQASYCLVQVSRTLRFREPATEQPRKGAAGAAPLSMRGQGGYMNAYAYYGRAKELAETASQKCDDMQGDSYANALAETIDALYDT